MPTDQLASRTNAPLPQPLSPDAFPSGVPDRPPPGLPGTTDGEVDFGAADRATFASLLEEFERARADLHDKDENVVRSAGRRLTIALSYLAGLLDGRGVTLTPSQSGFDAILGARATPDLDFSLDELKIALEAAAHSADTRSPTLASSIIRSVGDAAIGLGTGLIAAGIVTVPPV